MNLILLSGTNTANAAVYKNNNNCACLCLFVYVLIANEQPREDPRLLGGSLIEPCVIVPGVEKISNRCNIE